MLFQSSLCQVGIARLKTDRALVVVEKGVQARWSNSVWVAVAIVGGTVFAVSLCGILTRPTGLFLAVFWPTNAILLGLMVRNPAFVNAYSWIAAFIAYMLADLITGSSFLKASLLTAGNLAGVVVGYYVFSRLDERHRMLQQPSSVLSLVVVTTLASSAAGVVGMFANQILFGGTIVNGFFFWFVSEFVTYIALLPVVLTFPRQKLTTFVYGFFQEVRNNIAHIAPLIVFILCLWPTLALSDSAAAIAFPVPALLWCALTYSFFATTCLTLVYVVWIFFWVSTGGVTLGLPLTSDHALMLFRLTVMLIVLGPITVAAVMAGRNELLRETSLAKAAAEEAMAARSLLLATMTHELRSPLTIVISGSELISRQVLGPLNNPRYIEYAQGIGSAGRHLLDLVNDLLDTSKVEAGKIDLHPKTVNSGAVVEQTIRLVRGIAWENNITVIIDPGPWPDIYVDPRAIKQVLLNLLSNAIKFSFTGSSVVVSSFIEDDRLVLCVKDTGKGIAADDLAHLGEPYVQGRNVQSQHDGPQYQGTGLGLSLSRQLVAQHDGVLRIESTVDVGTTARFDVPLVKAVPAAE